MAGFAALYVLSAVLLAKATETLPIGTAYPIWTGIGAIGSVLVGIFFFHEPATFWRIFFISTLIISIVGLKNIIMIWNSDLCAGNGRNYHKRSARKF